MKTTIKALLVGALQAGASTSTIENKIKAEGYDVEIAWHWDNPKNIPKSLPACDVVLFYLSYLPHSGFYAVEGLAKTANVRRINIGKDWTRVSDNLSALGPAEVPGIDPETLDAFVATLTAKGWDGEPVNNNNDTEATLELIVEHLRTQPEQNDETIALLMSEVSALHIKPAVVAQVREALSVRTLKSTKNPIFSAPKKRRDDERVRLILAGLTLLDHINEHGFVKACGLTTSQAARCREYARAWQNAGAPGGAANPTTPDAWDSLVEDSIRALGRDPKKMKNLPPKRATVLEAQQP